jgi:hypothetical protein
VLICYCGWEGTRKEGWWRCENREEAAREEIDVEDVGASSPTTMMCVFDVCRGAELVGVFVRERL